MGKGRRSACLTPEESMSGMVILVEPAIGKEALRDMVMVMSVMRGNNGSGDGGEEGDASKEQERGKHGGSGAGKDPWQEED